MICEETSSHTKCTSCIYKEGLIPIKNGVLRRGGSKIFFRRGCTCLFLHFNTNKPYSFFFFSQNTSCIGKPQVISGRWGHTPCTLSLDPPLLHKILTWATVLYIHGQVSVEMHKIPVKKIVNYLTSTWLTLSLVGCVLWVFYLMVPHYDGSRTLKYFLY